MTDSLQNNARKTALDILDTWSVRKGRVQSVLHDRLDKSDNKPQTTDIVYGVVRNLNCIDSIIEKISGRTIDQISKKLTNIARIGTYELIYCSKTAPYAIVNEAVQIAKNISSAKQAGFVNAVLRNIIRQIRNFSEYSTLKELNTKDLPVSSEIAVSFKNAILPDPVKQPAGYLSKAFSIPQWLIESWLSGYGLESTFEICLACNRHPSIYLMPNTLKVSENELFQVLQSKQIDCLQAGGLICLRQNKPVNDVPGFKQGLFTVQDPTAASIFDNIDIKPGSVILDFCSAPGGKTIRLAQKIRDNGRIYATDIDPDRLKLVRQNCERLNINSVETVKMEDIQSLTLEKTYDIILLDVPCSNTGVLARRAEVRHKINQSAINKIVEVQFNILKQAANLASASTRIIYSTCSIQPDENQEQIRRFLNCFPGFILLNEALTLPKFHRKTNNDCDGGYLAELLKKHRY